jgi:hypothetical protein
MTQSTSPSRRHARLFGVAAVLCVCFNLQSPFAHANHSVVSVSPASGPTGGGTLVTITGSRFTVGAGPFTVAFGTAAPVSATRVDNTTLTATTPAHVAGTVNVTVIAEDGHTATLINAFTYCNSSPSITSQLRHHPDGDLHRQCER